jgi:hypothetical protein
LKSRNRAHGKLRLLKRNLAAKRCFEGKAFPCGDVVQNPLLKLDVHLGVDFFRDTPKEPAFSCAAR